MKTLKIVFLSLLALILIACAGIFIFLQVYDTDQYLPQITQRASLVLGRPVSIGHVGLGFSKQGITLDAGPVTVADDPDFTTQPFIKIDKISISLDVKSLIFQHQVHITHVLLQSPRIHFIRSQEGNINVRSIGQENRSVSSDTVIERSAVQRSEATKQSFSSKEISSSLKSTPRNDTIKSITMKDASISFIDQSQTMPLDIWLTNINASMNDFLLSKRSIQVNRLRLGIDLSQLDIKKTSTGIPDNPAFKGISGVVELRMDQLNIGPSGDITANGDITITGGVIKDFNIIKVILSHTLGVFGDIDHLLSGQLNIKLGSDDTIIEKGDIKFSIHDKTIFIDDSLIATNIFELTAKGSVDQGLNTDMQTTLRLNTDISASLIDELQGVKYLMDDSKRVTIGASLEGVIPHLKYKPNKDFRKKGKKAINAMFRQLFGA